MLGVGQSARTKSFTMSLKKKERLKPVALWDCAAQRFTSQSSHDSVNPKKGSQSAAHAPGNGEACDQQQSRRSSLAQPVRKHISVLRALRGA